MTGAGSRQETSTYWHLLEIDSPDRPEEPHVVAIKIHRQAWADGGHANASITLSAHALAGELADMNRAQPLGSMGGSFQTQLETNEYVLTGGNMLVVPEARGLRLGTYMQNQVISWVRDLGYPGEIQRIKLSSCDATTPEARDRRNHFYTQFGITFVWGEPVDGIDRAEGHSTPHLPVTQLKVREVIDGVRAFELPAGMHCFLWRGRQAEIARREGAEGHARARQSYETTVHGERSKLRVAWTIAGIGWGFVMALFVIIGRIT